jgi:aminoglycoside 6'-N-acetyltransferase
MAAPSTPGPPGPTESPGTRQDIRLRAMTAGDLPLMCRWLSAAHVHRWWHDSAEPADVSARYLPDIAGTEPSHPLIVEVPAGPIGFGQWYRWADYPDYGRQLDAGPDEAGFDYLIGEPEYCGRGLGTRLIAELIRHLREQDPAMGGVVVDPEAANAASRRVLEKNGLRLMAIKQVVDPDSPPTGPSAIYRRRFTA